MYSIRLDCLFAISDLFAMVSDAAVVIGMTTMKTMTYASISYVYARPVLHFPGLVSSACSQDLAATSKSHQSQDSCGMV